MQVALSAPALSAASSFKGALSSSASNDVQLLVALVLQVLGKNAGLHIWPLPKEKVQSIADVVSAGLGASGTVAGLVRTELAALQPRYWASSARSGLSMTDFANLYIRAVRRLGTDQICRLVSQPQVSATLCTAVPQTQAPSTPRPESDENLGSLLSPSNRIGSFTHQYELGEALRVGRLGVVRICHRRNKSITVAVTPDSDSAEHAICTRAENSKQGMTEQDEPARCENLKKVCRSVARVLISLGHQGGPADRVQDDFEALRSLEHPHVARLCEAYEDGESLHLIYNFVPGSDLQAALLRASQDGCHGISECWVASLVLQIALAIAYCHFHHVIHRNITLRKILLRGWYCWDADPLWPAAEPAGPPHAILLDAGLAEALAPTSGSTANERPYGTPAFMAPEVFRREYGAACDVWSLGIVTYILLAGRYPFESRNGAAGTITGPGCPPALPNHVSVDAQLACFSLLAKEEGSRPRAQEATRSVWYAGSRRRLELFPQRLYEDKMAWCE